MANDKTAKLSQADIDAILAENARLKAEAAKAESAAKAGFTFRVSAKGALAVYGMGGKFPVQLHPDQWTVLLDGAEHIREALRANAANLVPLKTVLDAAKAAKGTGGQATASAPSIAQNAVARAAATMAQRDANQNGQQ